jgi:hypothetical protein
MLLVSGSVASLAANVAVAQPTVMGRMIAAWPSFALIGSYELLMRQVRRTAMSTWSAAKAPEQRKEPVAARSSVLTESQRARAETFGDRHGSGRSRTRERTDICRAAR